MEAKSVHEKETQADTQVDIWTCALAMVPLAVVKCAIELRIADVLQTHGGTMTNADLSSALGCSPPFLHRIMRYLIHRGFFKHAPKEPEEPSVSYAHTPLSRLLMTNTDDSMASFVLLLSNPLMLAPWHKLSSRVSINGADSAFAAANGEGLFEHASENPGFKKLFTDGMSCHARVDMRAMIDQYPEAFEGVGSLVDVGGGDGTALRTLVKAFPKVRGINFDLPHVVSVAPSCEGVEHIAGNMFESVPKADAAILMAVLHDWSDEECIQILRKCGEAIPEETGKVIIAEVVIREEEDDKYTDIRLGMDMAILAYTGKGKERTTQEWEHLVKGARFTRFSVKHMDAAISVIEAYL